VIFRKCNEVNIAINDVSVNRFIKILFNLNEGDYVGKTTLFGVIKILIENIKYECTQKSK
jgi:ATP-dependent protease HslVU (ClpYQ) ATPase subunit